MKSLLIWLMLTGTLVQAELSNAPVEVTFAPSATNATPIWTPTPEQKRLQGSPFFYSTVNEVDGTVTHQLCNVNEIGGQGPFTSVVMATCKAGAPTICRFVAILRTDPNLTLFRMDPVRPLILLIDGKRVTLESEYAVTRGYEDQTTGKWVETYSCRVTEAFLRLLASAKKLSLLVPCKGRDYDRQFSSVELQRLAIFAKVYLPPEPGHEDAKPSNTNAPVKSNQSLDGARGGN